MKRVSDIVADLLVAHDVSHVFMVTGGGAMHLNDAIGRHPGLTPVFCHHEQACAMAAESYGRLANRLPAVNVTTGPGGINSLNGVFGAFVDSIGMIVISGQVKRETMMSSYNLALRQLGDQEVDITAMVAPITKSAEVLADPNDTRFVIERALWTARNGRPGPVWIDIPIDVQSAIVDESDLRAFNPDDDFGGEAFAPTPLTGDRLAAVLTQALSHLTEAERPVILVGSGVRLSGEYESFLRAIDRLGVPVATGFNAHDLIWDSHPLYVGRPGTVGDRAGNFAVQNADFVLILGCRMNIRQISYNWASFARAAFTVMIDIDEAELAKPTLQIDLPIHADLAEALPLLENALPYDAQAGHQSYLEWCQNRRQKYAVSNESIDLPTGAIDPYMFLDELFSELDDDDVVVAADGAASVVAFQVAHIQAGQRVYTNSGAASMGYDLPAAIGATFARPGERVICIAGDGSIMMNLQELQTIAGAHLPVKIVVLNNDGYSSIRQTQSNYFPDGVMGCDPSSGVTFPDFVEVGTAFGIPSQRCDDPENSTKAIRSMLERPGPQLLEVVVSRDRPFAPKLSSRQLPDGRMVSSPLEDMAPFLSREELSQNMLIPLVEE
jgi:acetolactate synthase I/II/III large subunit